MRLLRRVCLAALFAVAVVLAGHGSTAMAADAGSGTYVGTAPSFSFDLVNTGTTGWVYVVLVPPAGVNFVSGQVPGAPGIPCVVGTFAARAGELECGPFSPGVPPNTHQAIAGTVDQAAARRLAGAFVCGAPFQLWESPTGMLPYIRLGDVVFNGTCPPTMPPPPPPPPAAPPVTLKTAVRGQGTVTSEPDTTIACPPTCSGTYAKGTKVGLRATPAAGWEFDHWEDDCTGRVKTCTASMDGDRNVIAVFRRTPCKCVQIDTRARGAAFGTAEPDPTVGGISFEVDWELYCVGARGTCKGEIDVRPPAGSDVVLTSPNPVTVTCEGTCGPAGAGLATGSFTVRATSASSLSKEALAGRELTFTFDLYCIVDGKRVPVGRGTVTFAFDGNGNLDGKKSDLNGSGKPDAKDPPPPNECRCAGITAGLTVTNSVSDSLLAFDIDWKLVCRGRGIGCTGEIQELGAVKIDRGTGAGVPSDIALGLVNYPRGKRPVVACHGRCGGGPTKGTLHAVARSARDLKASARRNTTLKILLRLRCAGGKWSVVSYDLAFDNRGAFARNSPATRLGGRLVFKEP